MGTSINGKQIKDGSIEPADLSNITTGDIAEGSNLYHTNARVDSQIDSTTIDSEIPTGLVNGLNTSFTLAHSPRSNSLKLYLAGLRVAASLYNVSTNTVTFIVAPVSGLLLADYRY